MCDENIVWPSAGEWIEDNFPNLRVEPYEETSEHTCVYNCIAWAAGDVDRWWWPSEDSYWPEGVPLNDSIDAFKLAFKQELNYEMCASGELEKGFEKVAIYAVAGRTKHMARQLPSGEWTSKLGRGWDIAHRTLQGIECPEYGRAVEYMKRPSAIVGVEAGQEKTTRQGCTGLIFRAFRRSS